MAMTSESATAESATATAMPSTNGDAVTPDDELIRDLDSLQAGAARAETGAPNGNTVPNRAAPGPAAIGATKDKRFHIFVIDTRWNSASSKVLHDHINIISDLNIDDELFVLDRATSIALLRHYPLQVGRDPIIAVHDLHPRHRHRIKHTHGFRMHLGILEGEQQVLAALKMFARFLITHRNAADIDKLVRQDLHRQGLAGAIEIIGGHEHQKMIEG